MSDIDERLEEEILHASRKSFDSLESGLNANFLTDVQSEITRLRAENKKLREALKPCVDYFSWNGGLIRDEEYEAAAAALKETGDE